MKTLEFKQAFHYPFNRAKGLLNGLWILLPIIGWFALIGYGVRIVNEFIAGKYKQLPEMKFVSDLKLGFIMFIKMIPGLIVITVISQFLSDISAAGAIASVGLAILVYPVLIINFIKKQDWKAMFELEKTKYVFNNMEEYLVAFLKDVVLQIIFLIMIIVLVGIPCSLFTKNIFLANFYGKYVKEK